MFYCEKFLDKYGVKKKKSAFWTLFSSEAVVQLVSQDSCGLGQFDMRLNPQRKGTCHCVGILALTPPPTCSKLQQHEFSCAFSSKCFLYAAEC